MQKHTTSRDRHHVVAAIDPLAGRRHVARLLVSLRHSSIDHGSVLCNRFASILSLKPLDSFARSATAPDEELADAPVFTTAKPLGRPALLLPLVTDRLLHHTRTAP